MEVYFMPPSSTAMKLENGKPDKFRILARLLDHV
jgi:hypothetical protein